MNQKRLTSHSTVREEIADLHRAREATANRPVPTQVDAARSKVHPLKGSRGKGRHKDGGRKGGGKDACHLQTGGKGINPDAEKQCFLS